MFRNVIIPVNTSQGYFLSYSLNDSPEIHLQNISILIFRNKGSLQQCFEFKNDSFVSFRVIRLENYKLNELKMDLLSTNFQGEISLEKVYFKICCGNSAGLR